MANWLLWILPVSGFFSIKRRILSLCGIHISDGGCVNGHTWFYGRGNVEIGEGSWIGPRCRFYSDLSVQISIGKNCDIAPEVAFVTGSHEIGDGIRRAGEGYCKSIVVGDGCWIGARSTILGGVTIGEGAVVAAGSLVNKAVPAHSLVAGVPARVKKCLN